MRFSRDPAIPNTLGAPGRTTIGDDYCAVLIAAINLSPTTEGKEMPTVTIEKSVTIQGHECPSSLSPACG
jgi:hypothetical protein